MIETLPIYISICFISTTFFTLIFFYWTVKNSSSEKIRNKSKLILLGLTIWLLIQAVLSSRNIYNTNTNTIPPKIFMFGIAPTILLILLLLLSKNGRDFMNSLDLEKITLINTIRIPVEIILYLLYINKVIPELMTFEGRNFDIFAGVSAPIIAYYGLRKGYLNRNVILIWNFMSFALLINIVVIALLSAPSTFQKFAYKQPNIALLNFPFTWLPTFIVPIILFGHLVSTIKLVKN